MRRRQFLVWAGAALVLPCASFAQPGGKVYRLGFLGVGSQSTIARPLEALRSALRDLGYVEGRNLAIDYRFGDSRFERLPDLVADLLRNKPDVLV